MMHYTGTEAQKTRAAVGSSSCRRPLRRAGEALAQCAAMLFWAVLLAIVVAGWLR